RKEFLNDCAKKLNLVKPDIQLEKTNEYVQRNVLRQLESLTGYKSFSNIVTGIDPFIEKNIMNLTEKPYVAALIPDDSVRCLLYIINEEEQYIIDVYDKVRKVHINSEHNNTLLDGFLTENNQYY